MSIVRGMNHIGLTVPNIEAATEFFKKGLDAKVAYDSQTLEDPPRGGAEIERFLGIPEGSKIVKKRMLVIGNGPNIEMFQFENTSSARPLNLEDHGYNHLSFYTDDIEAAFEKLKSAAVSLCRKFMRIQGMRIQKVTGLFISKRHGTA